MSRTWVPWSVLVVALGACRTSPTERSGGEAGAPDGPGSFDWNAIYRDGGEFNHEPNRFLVAMAADRHPGAALDVAMGQGRNALYLASRGWTVTGIDTADDGLRLAREAAAVRGLHIDALRADLDTWDYGDDRWDLVVLAYSGCDAKLADSLRRALRRGGLVVFEGFHKDSAPRIGWTPQSIAALFAPGFRVLREDVVEEVSDWGRLDKRPEKLVQFATEKL